LVHLIPSILEMDTIARPLIILTKTFYVQHLLFDNFAESKVESIQNIDKNTNDFVCKLRRFESARSSHSIP